MRAKLLYQIAEEHPFPDYEEWWVMGKDFLSFMSQAIISEWEKLNPKEETLSQIQVVISEYIKIVYNQTADSSLAERFYHQEFSQPFHSGEFDALSYALFQSAFELLADQSPNNVPALAKERRLFSKRVGKSFFSALHNHLRLNLPSNLKTETNFGILQENIHTIGDFLVDQGYLRDHFAFTFNVDVIHTGKHIQQNGGDFLHNLHHKGTGYALYTMGYPAILPSAVYLYNTHGEAQHHSSRTIEELFDHIGCRARETDDFDPTGFPSDKVVELWEIRLI